jgi:hypothetical protein
MAVSGVCCLRLSTRCECVQLGPFCAVQIVEVLALWAAFLLLELQKSTRHRCTWGFCALYLVQSGLLAGVTAAFVAHQARVQALTLQLRLTRLRDAAASAVWPQQEKAI